MPKKFTDSKEKKFYEVWVAIRRRCSGKTRNLEKNIYFDRGITVCERWNEYKYFLIDMWDSYIIHVNMYGGRNTSIDRINNGKGYYKANCRWATMKEQSNNRRSNTIINGRTLVEWEEILGIKADTLSHRIHARGWSAEKALSTPINIKNRRKVDNL